MKTHFDLIFENEAKVFAGHSGCQSQPLSFDKKCPWGNPRAFSKNSLNLRQWFRRFMITGG